MNYTATLSKNGSIFLPKSARQALNISPGQKLLINTKKDHITIRKTKTIERLVAELDASMSNDNLAKIRKTTAGKTANELKETWANSETGKKYHKEKYGI